MIKDRLRVRGRGWKQFAGKNGNRENSQKKWIPAE